MRIGIAELQVGQLHRQPFTIELPKHIGRQLTQWQAGLGPQARQLQGAVVQPHTGFAAHLVDIEHKAGALNSGQCRAYQLQLGHLSLGAVAAQVTQLALPIQLQRAHQTLGGVGQQGCAQLSVQRQPVCDLRQCCQIKLVGLELAVCRQRALGPLMLKTDVRRRPMQPVLGVKAQGLGRQSQPAS